MKLVGIARSRICLNIKRDEDIFKIESSSRVKSDRDSDDSSERIILQTTRFCFDHA